MNLNNWASTHPADHWRAKLAVNYLFDTLPEMVKQARERPAMQDWFTAKAMKYLEGTAPRELVANAVRERFTKAELDAIDANIRNAAIRARDTFLD
jgi:hypothetical protein